jgi:hypothetical protein
MAGAAVVILIYLMLTIRLPAHSKRMIVLSETVGELRGGLRSLPRNGG